MTFIAQGPRERRRPRFTATRNDLVFGSNAQLRVDRRRLRRQRRPPALRDGLRQGLGQGHDARPLRREGPQALRAHGGLTGGPGPAMLGPGRSGPPHAGPGPRPAARTEARSRCPAHDRRGGTTPGEPGLAELRAALRCGPAAAPDRGRPIGRIGPRHPARAKAPSRAARAARGPAARPVIRNRQVAPVALTNRTTLEPPARTFIRETRAPDRRRTRPCPGAAPPCPTKRGRPPSD